MQKLRAVIRGVLVFSLVPLVILPGIIKSFFSNDFSRLSLYFRKIWSRISLWILGVQVDQTGEIPPPGPCIIVGNHRSYLDPLMVLRDLKALPVAKAEVGDWPMIGRGARVSGIMYVKRDSKNSRAATLEAMKSFLQKGYSVLVYPEGTTHVEPVTLPFQRGAFRIAAEAGFPILPVAMDYSELSDAWIGTETFAPHFLRCFAKPFTFVKLRYGPLIYSNDPNELMTKTRNWIDQCLLEFRSDFEN